MSNMIPTNGCDSCDSLLLANLIGALHNQWNDMTAPKKEEKEVGITSLLCFFFLLSSKVFRYLLETQITNLLHIPGRDRFTKDTRLIQSAF